MTGIKFAVPAKYAKNTYDPFNSVPCIDFYACFYEVHPYHFIFVNMFCVTIAMQRLTRR